VGSLVSTPTGSVEAAPAVAGAVDTGRPLAYTGSDDLTLVALAVLAIAGGLVLRRRARR
jgi:LPXTG-motif cell wall-anchored protein